MSKRKLERGEGLAMFLAFIILALVFVGVLVAIVVVG